MEGCQRTLCNLQRCNSLSGSQLRSYKSDLQYLHWCNWNLHFSCPVLILFSVVHNFLGREKPSILMFGSSTISLFLTVQVHYQLDYQYHHVPWKAVNRRDDNLIHGLVLIPTIAAQIYMFPRMQQEPALPPVLEQHGDCDDSLLFALCTSQNFSLVKNE